MGAIVVLGCAVRIDAEGHLRPGALSGRIAAGAQAYERSHQGTVVIVSGGRHWGAFVEADVMGRELIRRGVPPGAVVRERCSLTTLDNARFSAAILRRRGLHRALLVTCSWHVPRAVKLFAMAGIDAMPVPACEGPSAPLMRRVWRAARERFLSWIEVRTVPLHPS
ncbi:MAG TPA: YdcF family protein [Polyangiaceae bacterium]|nr:YdcF family protein [Polyangiaceae bacterium]